MFEQKSRRLAFASYMMALLIIFNAILPMGIALADGHGEDKIYDKVVTLLQEGKPITDGSVFDLAKPVHVEMSFTVPIQGGDPNGIAKGDTLSFKIAEGFKLIKPYLDVPLEDNEIGKLDITQSESDPADPIMGTIRFDGEDSFFTEGVTTSNIRLQFDMKAKDSSGGSSDGDYTITVLGKTFTVKKPDPAIRMTIEKNGSFVAGSHLRRIEWTVKLNAVETESKRNVPLKDYVFSDALPSEIGKYVPGSFSLKNNEDGTIADDTDSGFSIDGNGIRYAFGNTATAGERVITFQTELDDANYYTANRTIKNTAIFQNPKGDKVEASKELKFDPTWIKKLRGIVHQNSSGSDFGKNRSITWTIEINALGARLDNLSIEDILKETPEQSFAPSAS